ncbi:threonylcarbamoyl-AMP synthase [Candidatus Parcubacteria bacterium]|nr:MAG: threonylcarbamoyl-AMP synthase [Candidatus Parcubacteria bacterium]
MQKITITEAAKFLKEGKIGIIPTDTLYGIVGQALNKAAVERIYGVRKRNPDKPMIILISSLDDLGLFGVEIRIPGKNVEEANFANHAIKQLWPGKVSIILPVKTEAAQEKLSYLHRGTNTLAFRLPDKKELLDLLAQTGPLVAPSANLEGLPPAKTIKEAENYFGDDVDFYVDGGKLDNSPSKLLKIEDGKIIELRK